MQTKPVTLEMRPAGAKAFIPKFDHMPKNQIFTALPNGWLVGIVVVSPDLATEMLARNWGQQRPSKPSHIEMMATDILAGRWQLTHQGIAFDEDGVLYDGQNRLQAIITADAPAVLLVWFGVGGVKDAKEAKVIDTHKVRTLFDASHVAGLTVMRRKTSYFTSMIRYGVVNGSTLNRKMSQSRKLENLEKVGESIDWLISVSGEGNVARKVLVGPVGAAICCAYYHVDRDLLERFVNVLVEKEDCGPGDTAAKFLRQHILTMERMRHDYPVFLKASGAIRNFINRQDVTRCGNVERPIYPIEHLMDFSGLDRS